MKWVLIYLAASIGQPTAQWQSVPGFTSKTTCQEAAKIVNGSCFPDASTPPVVR